MADNPNPEKKVVVLSPAGSKVKPSDLTRPTPIVGPEISDPMKSRDSDTTSFKKLEPGASDNTGKKTIKLKPLKPKEDGEKPSEKKPISLDAFKTSKSDEPSAPPSPAQAPQVNDSSEDDDATVKIEKIPKPPPAPPPPKADSMAIPGAKQTIKLRPSATTPTVAPSDGGESPRPLSPATVKLKPSPSPAPVPTPPPEGAADEPGGEQPGEDTVPVQKKTIKLSPSKPTSAGEIPIPPMPGAEAPLPPDEEPTIPMQKKTIKLSPVKAAGATPAAPLKMPEETPQDQSKPSAPTVKLPPEPPTVKLPPMQGGAPPPPPPPPPPPQEQQQPAKRTLRLTKTSHAPPPAEGGAPQLAPLGGEQAAPSPQGEQPVPVGEPTVSQEPSIIFTIAAVLTFVILAYLLWIVVGQYGSQYMGWENVNVPGVSGKVK